MTPYAETSAKAGNQETVVSKTMEGLSPEDLTLLNDLDTEERYRALKHARLLPPDHLPFTDFPGNVTLAEAVSAIENTRNKERLQ